MNKIRVIDLLNKIANGEIKLGTKFNWHYKLYNIELIFTERQGALGLYFQREDRLIGLFERFNYQILNDEVEIIEDKKIENNKINKIIVDEEENLTYVSGNLDDNAVIDAIERIEEKINEIIDYINKGDK